MIPIETPYGLLTRDGNGPDARTVLSVPPHLHSPLFWDNVRKAARIRHSSFQQVLDLDEKNGRVILEPVESSLGQLLGAGAIPVGISKTIFIQLLKLLLVFEKTDGGFVHGYVCPPMIFQRSGTAQSPFSPCLGFSPGIWFGDQVLRDRNHPQYVVPEVYDEQKYRDKTFEGRRVSTLSDVYMLGFTVLELLAGKRLEDFFVDPVLHQVDWEIARLEIEDKAETILNDIPDVDGKIKEAILQMIVKKAADRPRRIERILSELEPLAISPINGPVAPYTLRLRSEDSRGMLPPVLPSRERSVNHREENLSLLHDDEAISVAWQVLLWRKRKKPYIAWPAMAFFVVSILVVTAYLLGPVKFRFDPVPDVVEVKARKSGQPGITLKSDTEGYYRLEPGTYDFLINSGGLTIFKKRLTLSRSKKLFDNDKEFDFEALTVPVFFDLQADVFKIFVDGREIDWKRRKIRFPHGRYEIVAISRTKISDLIRFSTNPSDGSLRVELPLDAVADGPEQADVAENADPETRAGDRDDDLGKHENKNTVFIHHFPRSLPYKNENDSAEAVSGFLKNLYSLQASSWDRFLPGDREMYMERFWGQVCERSPTRDEVRERLVEMERDIYGSIMQIVDSFVEEDAADVKTWSELSTTLEHWKDFAPGDLRFHHDRGFVFLKLEKWDDAEKSLSAAIEGGRDDAVLYERRCTAREKSGKWDEAIRDIHTALERDPERRDEFLLRQASLLVLRGEGLKSRSSDGDSSFREARDILDRLSAQGSNIPDIRLWHDRACRHLRQEEDAPNRGLKLEEAE